MLNYRGVIYLKAQVIRSFGEASVFQLEEIPVPELKPMHVLIQVKATSLNPLDTKIRSGVFAKFAPEFPAVLHGDVAGIITEVEKELLILKLVMRYTVLQVVLKVRVVL